MTKRTFTLAEAARLLQCHPETLRRAIREGSLRAARLGRGYRLSRADLQAFWTAQGGGLLFSPDEEGPDAPESGEAAREDGRKAAAGRRRASGHTQLSLIVPQGRES